MKILFYSDVHLRDYGSFPPYNTLTENGMSKELNNMISGCKFVADQICAHLPDAVFNLGDLYTSTEFVSTSVLHASSIALEQIKSSCLELGVPHIYVPGQHETINEKHNIRSITNLIGYFNRIALEPSVIKLNNYKIGMLPHITDKEEVAAQLKNLESHCDLIVTHLNFHGASFDNGKLSTSGISPNLKVPCISGDIHTPSSVGSVHYVGSLVQHKFYRSDIDNVGGILLFDTETKEIKRIPNCYSKHYIKALNFDDVLKIDPELVVLQVQTDLPKDKVSEILKDYEFTYIPVSSNEDTVYENEFSVSNPVDVFREFIEKDNPLAVDDFDSVFGEGDPNETKPG